MKKIFAGLVLALLTSAPAIADVHYKCFFIEGWVESQPSQAFDISLPKESGKTIVFAGHQVTVQANANGKDTTEYFIAKTVPGCGSSATCATGSVSTTIVSGQPKELIGTLSDDMGMYTAKCLLQ